jgi:hypothetical protein
MSKGECMITIPDEVYGITLPEDNNQIFASRYKAMFADRSRVSC